MYNDRYLSQIKEKANVRIVTESGREDKKILEFAVGFPTWRRRSPKAACHPLSPRAS
jgi:hypothetical protein